MALARSSAEGPWESGPCSLTEWTGNLVWLLRKLPWLTTGQAGGPGKERVWTWQGASLSGLCARLREGRGSYQMMRLLRSSWPWRKACPGFPPTSWLSYSHPPALCQQVLPRCLLLVSDAGGRVNTKAPYLQRWDVGVLAKLSLGFIRARPPWSY